MYDVHNAVVEPYHVALDCEPQVTGNHALSKRQEKAAIKRALNSGRYVLTGHDYPARVEHGRVVERIGGDTIRTVHAVAVMRGSRRGSDDHRRQRPASRPSLQGMDLELTGKVAVVTGASKGIGLAVTQALVDEGARVVAGARTTDEPRAASTGVTARGGRPLGAGRARRSSSSGAIDRARRVDVLVNNVGARAAAPRRLPRDERRGVRVGDEDELLRRPARDPRGPRRRWWSRAAGRSSTSPRSTRSSSPTAARSTTARRRPRWSTSASRSRRSSGRKGIRVNGVSPGPVSTDLWLGEHGVAADRRRRRAASTPTPRASSVVASIGGFATGRFTTPEEVATLVVLLASERTANVTGANFVIDGGLIKTT